MIAKTRWYVSFGLGSPFGGMMLVIVARTRDDVVEFINHHHLKSWCNVYDTLEGQLQCVKHKLTIVPSHINPIYDDEN